MGKGYDGAELARLAEEYPIFSEDIKHGGCELASDRRQCSRLRRLLVDGSKGPGTERVLDVNSSMEKQPGR